MDSDAEQVLRELERVMTGSKYVILGYTGDVGIDDLEEAIKIFLDGAEDMMYLAELEAKLRLVEFSVIGDGKLDILAVEQRTGAELRILADYKVGDGEIIIEPYSVEVVRR